MTLGENIRKLRTDKGYSILKLRELTGLSKSTISDIENDKSSPTVDTLNKIAIALNVDVNELFSTEYVTTNDLKKWDNEFKVCEEASIYEIGKNVEIVNIPIVGSVRAGKPLLVNENIEGYQPTLKNDLNRNKEYFYLRVTGDSMNQEFEDGSLLLVEKTPCIENGDIAVVLIDGMDATVKKIIQNNNMVTLIPMSNNPKYIPKMYDLIKDEVQIVGKVKEAIKKYY